MVLSGDISGAGGRLLVLLHGLGTTREVWAPMIAAAGPPAGTRVLNLDLRGHGRSGDGGSGAALPYSYGAHAADVAEAILALEDAPEELVVIGHSMGGAVALALASGWFGVQPARVLGLGIKVAWTAEEEAGVLARAGQPGKSFASREEALARYLKVSGLAGLVDADSPLVAHGVREADGGWWLATDPRTGLVGAPPIAGFVAAARCPLHLACGEHDAMVNLAQLQAHDPQAEVLAGLGHNAMVEDPAAVWAWVGRYRAA